jgi:hypothetical protein
VLHCHTLDFTNSFLFSWGIKQMNKTTLVVALFLGVLVAGLLARHAFAAQVPRERETFAQREIGAPTQGHGMGPYDGASGWLATEPAPVGTAPAGASQEPRLMFLAEPKVSTSCCPSAFNTDMGCVCLSDEDKTIMASRGGNRA